MRNKRKVCDVFYLRCGVIWLMTLKLSSCCCVCFFKAIFKSLLYEACGRMVNPVYGSVGLLCSGDWERCQAAVDAVLNGSMNVEPEAPPSNNANLSLKCCDIRHVCNDPNLAASGELLKVKARSRFKKPDHRTKPKPESVPELGIGPSVEEPGRVLRNGSRFEKGDVELELTLKSAQ